MTLKRLTLKQRIFVTEYLADQNATNAAKRAGYGIKSAHTQANRMLNMPHVQAAIDEGLAERLKGSEITAQKIENEIAKIAFIPLEDFILWFGKGVHVRLADKVKALECLARIKGLFKDKKEITFRDLTKEEVERQLKEWLEIHEPRQLQTVSGAVSKDGDVSS